MKKIKIFLASSITDLRVDRLELGDFIRQLNEICFDRGVQFSLIKCDDYDNAISAGGKQSEFDNEIRDSELCIFLFFRKVGEYTRHEFDVALDAFRATEKPKIVTYFKYIESPDEATGDVKAFMQMLDAEVKHYYNIYQSTDTLKLGVLMQIKLMGLDTGEPTLEQGKVYIGGQFVADTANLPVFTGNTSLAAMKSRLEALTKRYFALREKLSSDLDNEETEEEYRAVASEKSQTEKALREAEKGVLEAMKSMYAKTSEGGLSARRVAAYRALERGDYAGALEILDFDETVSDISHHEAMREGHRECIRDDVDALLQRIEVLAASGLDKDKSEEIGKIYREVARTVEKNDICKDPLLDYIRFLFSHNERAAALEVAKRLAYYYSSPVDPAPDEKRAMLWMHFGVIYTMGTDYGAAEEAYGKAIEIYRLLAKKNFIGFAPRLADAYTAMAVIDANHRSDCSSAVRWNRAALKLLEPLARMEPAEFVFRLPMCYISLGTAYLTMGKNEYAEEYARKAVDVCEGLLQSRNAALGLMLEFYLGSACNLLGEACIAMERYGEAESALYKAAEIFDKLVKADPAAFETSLSENYNALGNLYRNIENYAYAEEMYTRALGIDERMAERDPAAYEGLLAVTCSNLGNMYADKGDGERAWTVLQRAYTVALRHPDIPLCAQIIAELKDDFS